MSLTEQARWFVVAGDHQILLDEAGQVPSGVKACLPAALAGARFERFDEWQGLPCYLLDLGDEADTSAMSPLRQLMVARDEEGFRLAGRAWQLATFRRTHRFCGECGAPMTPKAGEWAQVCQQGHSVYPRISPCIIVAVRKGPEILLAAHRRHYQADDPMYTVLAGFVEAGGEPRAVRGAGGVRGERRPGAQCALCGEPALALPSQPDDGLYRRLRERRDQGAG